MPCHLAPHLSASSPLMSTVAAILRPSSTPYSARALRTARTIACSAVNCAAACVSWAAEAAGHDAVMRAGPAGSETRCQRVETEEATPPNGPNGRVNGRVKPRCPQVCHGNQARHGRACCNR